MSFTRILPGTSIFTGAANINNGGSLKGNIVTGGTLVLNPAVTPGDIVAATNVILHAMDDSTGSTLHIGDGSTGATTATVKLGGGMGSVQVSGPLSLQANTTTTGSFSFDLSGSTGAFKTSTGANTFGGSSNTFTNGILAHAIDDSLGNTIHIGDGTTGGNTTLVKLGGGMGAVQVSGPLSLQANTTTTGSFSFDLSGSTGAFKTTTGDGYFNNSTNTFLNDLTGNPAGMGPWNITTVGHNIEMKPNGVATAQFLATGLTEIIGSLQLDAGLTTGGSGDFDFSVSSGQFKTSTGAATFNGSSNTFVNAVLLNNIITKYNNENTAGVGIAYIDGYAQDVAWSGASTQIVSFSPAASGLYRVTIVVSDTTGDTVSATVSYTDAVNTTAQTLTPINGVVLPGNSTTSAMVLIRANTSTAIVVTLSSATQTTTKASAIIERMN